MKRINYINSIYLINNYANEILNNENKLSEKNCIQHGYTSVYEHTLSVAITCLSIANMFNIDIDKRSLIRGALLHDYFLYDWHIPNKNNKWHGFTHAKTALNNASKEYNLNKIERDMILSHMFPLNKKIPRYRESVILCIADKICSTQEIVTQRMIKIKKIMY